MTKLDFGTAGIRAPLGEGPFCMNATTLRSLTLALCDYLKTCFGDAAERGLCIAYDGRTHSDAFAEAAAEVALARGFHVRMFERPSPTPLLAFATRVNDAAAGIMVTASHNPPGDNGVKVYFRGGVQIVSPHDAEIARRMRAVVDADDAPRTSLEEARSTGKLTSLGSDTEQAYLDAIEGLLGPREAPRNVSVAYTAMCGVGSPITHALFARRPVRELVEVASQREPRVDFGGLSSPNPEHAPALSLVLALADEQHSDLVLAHDPDADRLAVGARDQAGTLRMLSGDEVGLLLGAHMLSRHDGPEKPLVVSTVVSSLALAHVAEASGARFAQSLTGFKWIADKGRELESKEGLRYVFGYEEAIGYAFAELGADKDGIAAAALIVELTGALAARGENLPSELERLSRAHGLFVSRQLTFQHEGDAGKECIAAIMAKARDVAPEVLLGTGAQRIDYALRTPRADLLVFHDASSNRICVRPSGTEPKLKLYLHARTDVGASESMASARARASSQLDALERSAKTLTER